jgi:N-acyl-L-homoserine lactone synthetase
LNNYGDHQYSDGGYSITNNPDARQLAQAHALRAQVFCQELQWVGCPSDKFEYDSFDNDCSYLVASFAGKTVGHLRIHSKCCDWMAIEIFGHLVPVEIELKSLAHAEHDVGAVR